MTCAVYVRFARDEKRAYNDFVFNELLRCFGFRIPMCINPLVASTLKAAVDASDFKKETPVQQAVEQLKSELIMKDIALRATQTAERLMPSIFSE